MSTLNRLAVAGNPYQQIDKYKRVLCVCSAGLLRSPTMAWALSQEPFNYNTRAAGITDEYALIPVDEALIEWADEIICADRDVMNTLFNKFPTVQEVTCLDIPDQYQYRDDELVEIIISRYADA